MEQEKIYGEQPAESEQAQEGIDEKEENEKDGASTSQSGSQFGKFSCAEDLVNAYNNLQAEFTRKCQKLSEIQKQIAEKEIEETSLQKDEPEEISPAFERDNWQTKVAEFLQKNDSAKEFSREISNEILKDKDLQASPDMLEVAWARVLSKVFKTPKQMAQESSFMEEFVLSNDEVKKRVLGSYLNEIRSAPNVIGSSARGGETLFKRVSKPTSLNDAKALAEKLLKT